MKGNKRILVLSILVLLLAATFTTYAIYRSSANGTGSIAAANWAVKINNTDIDSASFNFTAADITWTTRTGYNNTIAPGSVGYIDIAVDATGSEVDVLLEATLNTSSLPAGMTATIDGGNSQTIAYSTEANAMKKSLRINITWPGADSDETSKDTTDLAAEGQSLSLPVTLTAKQSVAGH